MPKDQLYCSFCGKPDSEVGYLVAGPSVFICNECVELCREIGHEMLTIKNDPLKFTPGDEFRKRLLQDNKSDPY